MVRQSFNHPSIYVWGIHNEVYHPHGYTAALTQSIHDLCKLEDPDRYTVSVNGYGNADHPVNQNADIQGMNRYFGWYERKIQDIKPWIEKMEKEYPWQRLMLTEYGADANIAHQTEILGDALNWTSPFYPETFQTKTHEYQWSIIARHPYIVASYLWNMFDFAVPTSKRGSVDARNMKGMMTFDRKIKKDSYFWYKANWSEEPVLAALLAFLGALFLFPDDFAARDLDVWLVPAGQLVLAFVLPFTALLCGYIREKKQGRAPPSS